MPAPASGGKARFDGSRPARPTRPFPGARRRLSAPKAPRSSHGFLRREAVHGLNADRIPLTGPGIALSQTGSFSHQRHHNRSEMIAHEGQIRSDILVLIPTMRSPRHRADEAIKAASHDTTRNRAKQRTKRWSEGEARVSKLRWSLRDERILSPIVAGTGIAGMQGPPEVAEMSVPQSIGRRLGKSIQR